MNTYQTYSKHIGYFIDYLKEHHPEIATLDKARAFVPEWLKYQESRGLSAWTIQTEAKALGKLFGITPEDDDYYEPPQTAIAQAMPKPTLPPKKHKLQPNVRKKNK